MISEVQAMKKAKKSDYSKRFFYRPHFFQWPRPSTGSDTYCLSNFIDFTTQMKSIRPNKYNIQITNIITPAMNNNSKRGWLPEEDQLLLQLVASATSDKLKWVEVAKVLHERTGRQRTGKQCRQRWQHQLNPAIVRDEWTAAEQIKVFELQAQHGNKWAQIAEHLPGRTDNAVKNFFYSAVRRVFTKVNMFLCKQRNIKEFKSIRQFQTDFLSKLMAVVDGNYSKKIRLTNEDAIQTAKQVLANVAVLSISHDENDEDLQGEAKLGFMVKLMHDFRKSCKKRKQKNAELDGEGFDEESVEEPSSPKSASEFYSASESSHKAEKSSRKHRSVQNSCEMKDENLEKQLSLLKEMKNLTSKVISGEQINTNKSIECTETNEIFNSTEPTLFRIFSGFQQKKTDKWWEVLNVNNGVSSFRMEEEIGNWEWREDAFLLGNQQEDMLGSSQLFGSGQGVTKFKMLEASIALEDLLLNSKKSSKVEPYPQIL